MITPTDHTTLSKSVLKTLLYFDIFQYPLTATEIFTHLPTNHVTPDGVHDELIKLTHQSIIYPIHDFYSVQNNPSLGSRRIKGNQLASQCLLVAQRQSQLISRFPFVKAVMASGSLSKNYMDESSDLDFFVVTSTNRLWIVRMLLALYRRLFLSNSIKIFCTNYFVTEDHLEIEEKNIFTAIELTTLIPLYGKEYYHQLWDANKWVNSFFPNCKPRPTETVPPTSKSLVKTFFERTIDLGRGNNLERLLLKINARRLQSLYGAQYSKEDFEIAFKSKKNISKGHPRNLQKKILERYQQKLVEFGNRLNINWNE